jgi:hypothetical protein
MTICGKARAVLFAAVVSTAGSRARAQTESPPSPASEPEPPPPSDSGASPEPPPPAPPPQTMPPPAPLAPAPSLPEESAVIAAPAPAPIWRPRLSAAVGMGSTFDSVGFSDGGVHAIPAFVTVLGVGDGRLGLDLGAFASEAAGRHPRDAPVDRLAVDLFGVIRPAARYHADDSRYQMRILHALAAEFGLGFERDGRSAISGTRFVVHTGARADLPLAPIGEPTQLNLRIAVRRALGLYTPRLSGAQGSTVTQVGDSAAELYAAIVVVF